MRRRIWEGPTHGIGAPPARPDFGSTPVVRRPGGIPAPTIPNLPVNAPIAQPTFQTEVYPWWDKKWDAAQAWSINALNFTITAGQVAGPTTLVPNLSYTIPLGSRGVLKSMLMTIQNPVATTKVALTIYQQTGPVQGWSNVPFAPLSATAEALPFNDMNITLQQNDTLTFAFTETSAPASNWTASLYLLGWQITQAEIDRVMGQLKY